MIRSTTPASEMVINLDGPDGNAFCLIACLLYTSDAADE